MVYLQKFLPLFNQDIRFELYGFDVSDSKVQFDYFFEEGLRYLFSNFDNVDWSKRLKLISEKDKWQFEDSFFDIVYSNQVCEHVTDHEFFFSENSRVLKKRGLSVHIFPLRNYIVDGHVFLPFVHKINNWFLRYKVIFILSALGLGKWKKLKTKCNLNQFSKSYSDFLSYYCNYITMKNLLDITTKNKFRCGFNYTSNFFQEKIKEILNIDHKFIYKQNSTNLLSIHFFKYLSSITLYLEKEEEYENYIAKYLNT